MIFELIEHCVVNTNPTQSIHSRRDVQSEEYKRRCTNGEQQAAAAVEAERIPAEADQHIVELVDGQFEIIER